MDAEAFYGYPDCGLGPVRAVPQWEWAPRDYSGLRGRFAVMRESPTATRVPRLNPGTRWGPGEGRGAQRAARGQCASGHLGNFPGLKVIHRMDGSEKQQHPGMM